MRRKGIIILLALCSIFGFKTDGGFREEQLKFERVREAFGDREMEVVTKLKLNKVNPDSFDLYIRAFKTEGLVEAWVKNKGDEMYRLFTTYTFCSNVGLMGPKREQGDLQIPEGFYMLSKFNPESNFHLSLKVSYPNKSDSLLSGSENLGGQIFIHGGCATIGCIPITNYSIAELYVLAVMAKDKGKEDVPIHIFPARMNYSNYKSLLENTADKELHIFWTNLKPVYQHFEQTGRILGITINHQGRYLFSE